MSASQFGKDVSCTDSLRSGRYATGVRLVAEACYRRLITPRGTLRGGEDEASYGLDLTTLVGKSNPRAVEVSLPGKIRSELTKDERVESVDVEVLTVVDGPSTTFVITISVTTAEGPFTLQVSVDDVTTELLGITTT
jgi:hypothetical protein